MADHALRYRIGVDIGGTFTDFTVIDDHDGRIAVGKILTTPQAPEAAVLAGLDAMGADHADLLHLAESLVHATTLATNVVIERKGLPTALLTTEGFRDILEIGRENRYNIYDLFIEFPKPLIDRPLRFGIRERIYSDGRVLEPLDEDAVRSTAKRLREERIGAVAVCYLHAYRNPAHELRTREILEEEMPGLAVSLSHEVHPEPKEFERVSTTVVDAYVKPVMDAYLRRLEVGVGERGFRRPLLMMQSNGGVIPAAMARRHPVQIIESGPAAGVEAAAFYGRMLGLDDILSFDMGGTTAKLCIIQDGRAARTRTFEVDRVRRFRQGSGLPVAIPVYDLLEIGAGGGSIARINDLGLLQVGPDSAGSMPGPACYGRGGTAPTVTDADLVLGHLDAGYFLGGEMALDAPAAWRAIEEGIARPGGLTALAAAHGIADLVDETMASAARVYVADKGKDAGELTMIAFGGAGPLHAVALARKLGCPRVVIPPMPGVMSSFGLLASPLAFEQTFPVRQLLDEIDAPALEATRSALAGKAAASLPAGEATTSRCIAELWHLSQDYPLEVEIAGPLTDPAVIERARADFRAAYEALYGRTDDENPLELVALRVQALSDTPRIDLPAAEAQDSEPKPKGVRPLYSTRRQSLVDAPVYARANLASGVHITGPAVIEEKESTTILGDDDSLTVDGRGFLIISVAAAREPAGRTTAWAT